jgi:crotonobetainyl-CoA:carnitine CoA-transferase CaiB-like acyl-CoA transferase
MEAPRTSEPALRGIRVLDLGRFISAPFCGMILAGMGAEVVRVERPGGDEDRRLGLVGPHGENFTYAGLARNKKGITLDVRRPEAREVVADLIARADVFLHNFSPAAAAALGLSYERVRSIKPDIIYTAISCYGSSGPHAHRTGFDPIAQTGSGAAALNGFDGDPPLRAGVPWVDYSTGMSAALGTVLALRHRDAAGEGQAVDCALLQTAVSYAAPAIAEAVVTGQSRPRLGNRAAYLGPSDLYQCRDGFVYVACATTAAWRALADLIGRPDLRDAPGLRTPLDLFERRADIDPLVAAWIRARTAAEVVAAMDEVRVPCGVYRAPADVPDDPQVRAGTMLPTVDLDVPGMRPVPVGALPFRLSRTPEVAPTRAPRVGEDNDDVYARWLGYGAERLASLRATGVI